jgi:hypothetical protein
VETAGEEIETGAGRVEMDLESGRTVGGLWVDGEGWRAVIDASGAETRTEDGGSA